VPIGYRGALLSTLLHVNLIPTSHNGPNTNQLQKSANEHSSTYHFHSVSSNKLLPINYRGALLSNLLHVSLIPISTTGLVPIRYREALLSSLLHLRLPPTGLNRLSAYQLQRSTTEHCSTCETHYHKPQQAQKESVT
jgi:hypothetical protein